MIYIGIDPGLTGGIAVICPDKIEAIPMPSTNKGIDVDVIHSWIDNIYNDVDPNNERTLWYWFVAYIELVHSMPKQGVASSFKFGLVTGEIRGMIKTSGIPLHEVTPQAWKKVILAGTDKSKEAAIDWCRRAYPQVSLLATPRSYVPHSGMADALCIAEYGRRTYK